MQHSQRRSSHGCLPEQRLGRETSFFADISAMISAGYFGK